MRQQNVLLASLSLYRYEWFLFLMYLGVIGALAHPSFINEEIMEMPSEPKQYLSSMNREQKAYFAQRNTLANSVEALGTGIQTETPSYNYSVVILCKADSPDTIEPPEPTYYKQRGDNTMNQLGYHSSSFLPNGCGCLVLSILLTSVIGISIFSSSFLCSANKAKQSEAKEYVFSMNKAQQAKFALQNSFATSIDTLGLGILTETMIYKYSLRITKTAAFSYAVAKENKVKSYVGGVFLVPAYPNTTKNEMMNTTILCETTGKCHLFKFEPDQLGEPIYQNGKLICGEGTIEVTKYSN